MLSSHLGEITTGISKLGGGLKSIVQSVRGFVSHDEITKYYVVKETLGAGAFAEVKRAVNRKTGDSVAIKMIDKRRTGTKITHLEAEVDILNKVRHENCVSVIEIFDSPNYLYLVMDLVEGGELFEQIINLKTFDERHAARTVRDILRGLRYLHKLGIVHRDLKPENLLLSSKDPQKAVVKITDFGLSKLMGRRRFLESRCGTPAYASPEILRALPYDGKVDLWAVGVILYILLSGYAPFYGDTTDELFERIMAGAYHFPDEIWSSVSESAKDLVCKLLTVDPADRPSAHEALQHPWIKQLESEPTGVGAHLRSCTNLGNYVNARKQSYAYIRKPTAAAAVDDTEDRFALPADDPDQYEYNPLSESAPMKEFSEEELDAGPMQRPLPDSVMRRIRQRYPLIRTYRTQRLEGHRLGVPDPKVLVQDLDFDSPWKQRAADAGFLRPFLLLASMHPQVRIVIARQLGIDIAAPIWYGDPQREAFEILAGPKLGIIPRTMAIRGLSSKPVWYDTLVKVMEKTLTHKSDSKELRTSALEMIGKTKDVDHKSMVKACSGLTDDSALQELECRLCQLTLQKLFTLATEAKVSLAESLHGFAEVDDVKTAHPDYVENMKKDHIPEDLIVECANFNFAGWWESEDALKVGKVFQQWAQAEKKTAMRDLVKGTRHIGPIFPAISQILIHRIYLAEQGISIVDYYPKSLQPQ